MDGPELSLQELLLSLRGVDIQGLRPSPAADRLVWEILDEEGLARVREGAPHPSKADSRALAAAFLWRALHIRRVLRALWAQYGLTSALVSLMSPAEAPSTRVLTVPLVTAVMCASNARELEFLHSAGVSALLVGIIRDALSPLATRHALAGLRELLRGPGVLASWTPSAFPHLIGLAENTDVDPLVRVSALLTLAVALPHLSSERRLRAVAALAVLGEEDSVMSPAAIQLQTEVAHKAVRLLSAQTDSAAQNHLREALRADALDALTQGPALLTHQSRLMSSTDWDPERAVSSPPLLSALSISLAAGTHRHRFASSPT